MCISIFFCNFAADFKKDRGMSSERERIEKLMKSMNLSARQFASEIHVQPGTISNMMGGRNNPSYEVIKRIMERYPTLNPEWLIAGRGDMWRTEPGKEPGLFDNQAPDPGTPARRTAQRRAASDCSSSEKISRIVVYYTDNTYQEFRDTGMPV